MSCQKKKKKKVQPIGSYLPGSQSGVGFLELVPDGLEDGGEGGDSDAGADQHADLVVEDVLAGCAKWAVHAHPDESNSNYVKLHLTA